MTGPARTPSHALAGIGLLVATVACFAVLDTPKFNQATES